MARQRSAKPSTAVRIRSRPQINIIDMGVTRLKRKDRRNKMFSRMETQVKKLGTNIEIGSRAISEKTHLAVQNRAAIAIARKEAGL